MARRFTKIADCRRYMASLINRIEKDELKASAAQRGYLCNLTVAMIRDHELEARVTALETSLEDSR